MRSLYAYRFETDWRVDGDIRQIWAIISGDDYGAWWPGVSSKLVYNSLAPEGVGNRYRFIFQTKLPYRITFEAELLAVREPEYIKFSAKGDLEGIGVWSLRQEGKVTCVRYVWRVNSNLKWMNALAPLLKPLFVWNHDQVMEEGAKGLAAALGTELRAYRSG